MRMQLSKNQELLAKIVELHESPTVTVVTKIAYLVDLVAMKELKKPISNYAYIRYFYGPYDEKIAKDIEELMHQGILSATLTFKGEYECLVYTLTEKVSYNYLTKAEQQQIEEVLDMLQGYSARTLTEIAYKTKPMQKLGATLGGQEGLHQPLSLEETVDELLTT